MIWNLCEEVHLGNFIRNILKVIMKLYPQDIIHYIVMFNTLGMIFIAIFSMR